MTAIVEARCLISSIAGPMEAGAQIQEMLSAVAQASGLGHRRLRGIWNREARAIRAEELDALRRAAAKREKQEVCDRDEFQSLARQLVVLAKRMAEIDPQFNRAILDAQSGQEYATRPMDSAVASRGAVQ